MTAVIFGMKILSRTRVQGSLHGYVDCQQVRSIDPRNLFFSKLKLLILRRGCGQLWMKSTAKVPDECFA